MNRWNLSLFLFISSPFLMSCMKPKADKEPEKTRILWDSFGVPHIFAPNKEQALYAFGWAQARSHGDLILRLYGQARGRAAEYWGKSYLEGDRWMRRMGVSARAKAWYAAGDANERAWLDAFARGINDYAAKHGDLIDNEVEVVLPVTGIDLMAHNQRAIQFTFMASPGRVGSVAGRWQPGSNAWAIAPSRSVSGKAMLLANPHLPWSDLFLFYEAQIKTPELDFYGIALVGHPALTIGFNDYLGWTHTVNTHDGVDLFELELAEGGYRWEGKVRPLVIRFETLKIRAEDGTLTEEIMEIKESVHGPIVDEKGGKALALRMVGLEAAHLLGQYLQMAEAKNLKAFQKALAQLQNPMFTTMYADRDGHIMHLFGGLTPKRAAGDWDHWKGVVPGTGPVNLWTETHGYEELPRVIDPASGWLQNANDPPWTTTFPVALKAEDYPGYMAPDFMHFRAQSSARLLAEDNKISFAEMIRYKHSTRMEAAERILDDLEIAVEKFGDEKAKQAMAVLKSWDRQANAKSVGAVLFVDFFDRLRRKGGSAYAAVWSKEHPRSTPDGLADPAAAADLLSKAATALLEKHGRLDVAWGELNRLRRDDVDLPASGGPGAYGIFRVFNLAPDGDGRRKVIMGDSFVAAIEFGEKAKARVLLSYGNASQPGSPHRSDQLTLLSQQKLRDAWRTEEQIRTHLEDEEVFP